MEASFGFQSEKSPLNFFNASLLINLNEHHEIFSGFGTIIFGGSLFAGYKYYINNFSKPSPYASISIHRGSYFDSPGVVLEAISPSVGYELRPSKKIILNFGFSYVFLLKNNSAFIPCMAKDCEGKNTLISPFLNVSIRSNIFKTN